MVAYILAQIDVSDPEAYKAYTAETPGVVQKFGGRFIVRGGDPEALEGELPAPRVVLIEFPDKATIKRFYASAEYQKILPLRLACSTGRVTILEGA
jgi:uncharacterized protein (DUF1330 family)